MSEILCPNCGKAFSVDESGYSAILKQVHDREFDKAVEARMALAEVEKKSALEVLESKKEVEIAKLKSALESKESAIKLAINEAITAYKEEVAEDLTLLNSISQCCSRVSPTNFVESFALKSL